MKPNQGQQRSENNRKYMRLDLHGKMAIELDGIRNENMRGILQLASVEGLKNKKK